MILTNRLAVYLFKIAQMAERGEWGKLAVLPMVCPECGKDAEEAGNDGEHTLIQQTIPGGVPESLFYVVIGCEGYWCYNPNELGIKSPHWMSLDEH